MTDSIVTDEAILTQVSRDTTFKECMAMKLFERLPAATETAWTKGVGISAVQIGVHVRFAYYKDPERPMSPPVFLINPRIVKGHDLQPHRNEGCLSMPDRRFQTWRYREIEYSKVVNGQAMMFRAQGMEAVIIQHEIDHMDGVLCCDRIWKPKVCGRNEACPCASGLKFKKCCMAKESSNG